MLFKTLIEIILKSFITNVDKNNLLSKISEIQRLLKFKSSRKYEYFYLNKENIHELLYENDNIIKIQSNAPENNLCNIFYIILLIKHQPYLTNYIYEIDYIENVNNLRKKNKKIVESFILSIIVIELINNFKSSDIFCDNNNEKKLNNIYIENEKIKNDFINLNKNNFNLNKNEVESNDLEEIYLKIIISLIKDERLKDFEYSKDILEQLDLQEINITPKMYQELFIFFKSEEKLLQNYMINKIVDLYNEQKINFYFVLFKYLFKNSFYIYNIPFLLQNRNAFLNILNNEVNKFSELNKNVSKDMRKKIEYVIKRFCDSNYYYKIYLGTKYVQLNYILKYYKNYLFNSKKNEIKLLEEFIISLNIDIDYEKYLEDLEKAEKMNDRFPAIKYLVEGKNKNLKNENDINECIQKWEELEKNINNKKYKIMKKDDKEIMKNYFNNIKNKDILHKIFTKNIYDYFINENENNQKNNNIKNIEVINDENNLHQEKSNNLISEIKLEKEEIEYNSIEGKEINNDKTLKVITENTIYNQNSKFQSNLKNKNSNESKISLIYDSEIQKEDIYFNETEFNFIDYLDTIGTHKNFAEFITETNNGYFVSGGGDEFLLVYNTEFHKVMETNNKDWISYVSEKNDYANSKFSKRDIVLFACTREGINLIKIDTENFNIYNKKQLNISSPTICLANLKGFEYLICADSGVYSASNLNTELIEIHILKESNIVYKGGIIIDEKIVALCSNKILNGGQNLLNFFYLNKKKLAHEIKGYSFVNSVNGLAVIPRAETPSNNKFLLCACKKYEHNQKNGILLVNIQIEKNIKFKKIKHTFYNTGNFEVYCFCPILLKSKEDWERIFDNNIKAIDSDYFLVGGYNKKKGKGVIKLYKLNKSSNIEDSKIEFIQDIEIQKKNKFKGFRRPISCIIQTKKRGRLLVSCWDGNVYLFSRPKIETFLNYEEKIKYDCMSLIYEEEKDEIVVEI